MGSRFLGITRSPTGCFNGGEINMILNGDTGAFYMKSDMLSEIDPSFPKDAWLQLDMSGAGGNAGYSSYMQQTALGAGGVTVGQLIYQMSELGSAGSVYDDVLESAGVVGLLFGDDNFTVRTVSGVTTYTLDITKEKLISKAVLSGAFDKLSGTFEMMDLDFEDIIPDFHGTLVFREKKRRFSGYEL